MGDIETWLQAAIADAEKCRLPALKPLLEGLAQSTALLRAATFNPRADRSNGWPETTNAAAPPQPLAPRSGAVESGGAPGQRHDVGAIGAASERPLDPGSIETLGNQLRTGATSARALVEDCLRQIEAHDGSLNAFILVTADLARRQAADADAELAAGRDRGPLHGIPISLKDLIDVSGLPTTAASRVRSGHVAAHDAQVVTRLRDAGAVIVGKTNLHEFAFGTTNEDSAFGPARHPLDQSRSPGGSSGGSAISVATGMAVASIGTDTGGSIRIPAAACGLVGLKPTVGEVSTQGLVPLSCTLDHVGPLARTVSDAWSVCRVLCGRSALPPSLTPLAGLRLAVPRRYFCDVLEPDVRSCFDDGLGRLGRAEVRVDEVNVDHADWIAPVYLQIVLGEAAAYHATTLASMPERYTAPVRHRLEMARYALAEDYVRARAGRRVLRDEVDRALGHSHALVLPTIPIVAPHLGESSVTIDDSAHPIRNLMLRLTQLFNITGHPVVTLPCGTSREGLPIGLQLVGRLGHTATLLQTALGIERVLATI